MALPPDHPQRARLTREVHARPFAPLQPPERATHLALFTGEDASAADEADFAELCRHFGAEPPATGAKHALYSFPEFRVKWERHTEFATYTFFRRGELPADPFAEPVFDWVPRAWADSLPGPLIAAVNVAVAGRGDGAIPTADVPTLMGASNLPGAWVSGEAGAAFMDFAMDSRGFGRAFIQDHAFAPYQAGRLVQRLLEIETYRLMALAALPMAREQAHTLSGIESRLAEITAEMTGQDTLEHEHRLLGELTTIAERVENMAAASRYRYAAARAYYDIVQDRIADLRERRIEGFQTFTEFIDRRLAPAMRTCRSADERRERLSDGLSRAVGLLQARVGAKVEAQNRDLLASMDQRTNMQLRLQATLEGLSVAAITYYTVNLVNYAAVAFRELWPGLPVEAVTAGAIPVVALSVWGIIRRIRRLIEHGPSPEPGRRHDG